MKIIFGEKARPSVFAGFYPNVYARTREGCEEKLAELTKTMKAEIAVEKKRGWTTNDRPSIFAVQ